MTALIALSFPALALQPTPADMLGPYYPDALPADQDNDLTRIQGAPASAAGRVLELSGRVLDTAGKPLPGVRIEIWQTDANGRYIHSQDNSPQPRDPYFQGFGAMTTGDDGRYRFRTVVPKAYVPRPAHIHAQLLQSGKMRLVTQIYFPDQAAEPGLPSRYAGLRGARQTLRLESAPGATVTGHFDFILPTR